MRQPEQNRKGILRRKTLSNGEPGYEINQMRADFVQDPWVTWEAPTDSAITIIFPPGADPFKIGATTLMPGGVLRVALGRNRDFQWHGKHPDKPSQEGFKPAFAYRYTIYCHETRNFAVMNSDPEIIIEGDG